MKMIEKINQTYYLSKKLTNIKTDQFESKRFAQNLLLETRNTEKQLLPPTIK